MPEIVIVDDGVPVPVIVDVCVTVTEGVFVVVCDAVPVMVCVKLGVDVPELDGVWLGV